MRSRGRDLGGHRAIRHDPARIGLNRGVEARKDQGKKAAAESEIARAEQSDDATRLSVLLELQNELESELDAGEGDQS
jgi:hypothetical protein